MPSDKSTQSTEHFVTLFDNNFLPLALCLHASLAEHARPFRLWMVCMDEEVERNLRRLALPAVSLIPLAEVETPRLLAVKPARSRVEYCWTITPFAPQAVFDHDAGVERVTYLDADLYFFAAPHGLIAELETANKHVLITEHAYDPRYERSGRARRAGRFCVQFLTFRRTPEASAVMRWWQERCLEWCYARAENGRFGDQKYLDAWPELFGGAVHILTQKDKTLAPWNVAHTHAKSRGKLAPVFYHFHGLRIESEERLCWYSGYRIGGPGLPIYQAYTSCLRRALQRLSETGMRIPCLPRPRSFLARCLRLKHRFFDGEKVVPLRA